MGLPGLRFRDLGAGFRVEGLGVRDFGAWEGFGDFGACGAGLLLGLPGFILGLQLPEEKASNPRIMYPRNLLFG